MLLGLMIFFFNFLQTLRFYPIMICVVVKYFDEVLGKDYRRKCLIIH